MKLADILKKRDCGFLRITSIRNYNYDLNIVLNNLGFVSDLKYLREIDHADATLVIKEILWKDLAYGSEMMSEKEAHDAAIELIDTYSEQGTEFYTNGDWVNYHSKSGCSFSPLTEATFDAGVIIRSQEFAACIWVQDED